MQLVGSWQDPCVSTTLLQSFRRKCTRRKITSSVYLHSCFWCFVQFFIPPFPYDKICSTSPVRRVFSPIHESLDWLHSHSITVPLPVKSETSLSSPSETSLSNKYICSSPFLRTPISSYLFSFTLTFTLTSLFVPSLVPF